MSTIAEKDVAKKIESNLNITEDYVSFETAKLLKEKGFDEITVTWYTGKGKFCVGKNNFNDYHMNHFSNMATAKDKNKCSAPTLQRAMKWVKEVHKIYIQAFRYPAKIKKDAESNEYSKPWYYQYTTLTEIDDIDRDFNVMDEYDTSEEACEAALKYVLENLI
jgi:hypothetical protein